MRRRGVLVTFEGGEGSGKSTHLRVVARVLREAGVACRELREPGGTAVGEAVRAVLLDPEHAGLDERAELLLYEAARAQLVAELIEPALEAGEVVMCDRYYDSTTAYQGHGRGLPLEHIAELNALATSGLTPDLTLLFDVDPVQGLERATRHGSDRLESEDLAFHERVRAGFLEIARIEPERVRVVDAGMPLDAVSARAVEIVCAHHAVVALLEPGR